MNDTYLWFLASVFEKMQHIFQRRPQPTVKSHWKEADMVMKWRDGEGGAKTGGDL